MSSIWLLPPPSHPLHPRLTTLITRTLPARFPRESSASLPSPSASSPPSSSPSAPDNRGAVSPHFFPAHVTLTSGVPPARYRENPQAWLEGVFSARVLARLRGRDGGGTGTGADGAGGTTSRVRVRFEKVVSQDVFFRRCFVRVGFDGVRELAGIARAGGVVGEQVELREEGGFGFGEETERWLSTWRQEYGPHLSLMYGNEPITDETLKEVTKVVQEAGLRLSDEQGAGQAESWDGWDGGVIWLVPTDRPISEWGKPIATVQL